MRFLDSPSGMAVGVCAANDIVSTFIHDAVGRARGAHAVPPQRGVGRPSTRPLTAPMIASGLFDRHPKLQVLIVIWWRTRVGLGRLEFNWRLTTKGSATAAGKPYKNDRRHPTTSRLHLGRLHGFQPIGLRAAVEMCGVDRVVFGSDYGPIPYGIKEHVQIVEDVLPSPAERNWFLEDKQQGFRWPSRYDLVTPLFINRVA